MADGIRRAHEARVSKPPQYGFSQEALIGRWQILQAAFETLSNSSSRGEYNRGLTEDLTSTVTTHVPWDKVSSTSILIYFVLHFVLIFSVPGLIVDKILIGYNKGVDS